MKNDQTINAGRCLRSTLIAILLGLLLFLTNPFQARAAGLLIADGGLGGILEIKEHDVQVTINNGIAVTRVTQVFHNTEDRQVEALYTFPVPKGATVANFSMWINGKEMVGEVLEKERAREIYNSYKQTRQDPGLLEQVDYKRFEMRIFPINAGADQKVEVTYYQELSADHNEVTYVYPLATITQKALDTRTTGKFAINVDIKSAIPIGKVTSPSHGDQFAIARHAETYGQASLESSGDTLARDVVVYYTLARPNTGIDLITSNPDGEDGYFYMTLTTGRELEKFEFGMDYVFLLDVSGSMAHDQKLAASRQSIEAFITELDEKDRFEVMTFNVQPQHLFGRLQGFSEETRQTTVDFLNSREAKGGTVLNSAMLSAYRYGDPDRQLNVVVISDGMTEQAERRRLLQLIRERPGNAKVFCIGVGNEVNRPLLEQMAESAGGLAAFISHGDNFSRQAKAFRRKLTRPAATGLDLQVNNIDVYDVEPKVLPNLYHGTPIRVYGRYRGSGEAEVTITGEINGRAVRRSVTMPFPAEDSGNPEIERMWALKRVDRLQKEANAIGGASGATVSEIIRLGELYSIVTEYTSFLVLENDAEFKRWKIDRRNVARFTRDRGAQQKRKKELEAIRKVALDGLGPQAAKQSAETDVASQPARNGKRPSPSTTQPGQSRDLNMGVGTGPVGPLFIVAAAWLARRRHQRANRND